MLEISEAQMTAFDGPARAALRTTLLQHWFDELRTSAALIGPSGREQVVREIETLALQDRSLDTAELTMIADLRLVALAGEARKVAMASAR